MGQTRKQTRLSKMEKTIKVWIKAKKLANARLKDKSGNLIGSIEI